MSDLNSSISTIKKIKNALIDGKARNISEISRKAELTWDITKTTLEKLEVLEFVIRRDSEKKKYIINPFAVKYNTYFNLPITQEEKKRVYSYYNIIQKKWKEITNENPTQIQVYKVLSKLNKQEQLKLPFALYTYGEFCIVPYNPEESYSEHKNENIDKISTIIDKYKDFKTIRQLRKAHYNENQNKTYQYKEEIIDKFYQNSISEIIEKLQVFIKELRQNNISSENIEITYQFLDNLYLYKLNSEKLIPFSDIRDEFIETFKTIWQLITLEFLENDLKDKYEPEIIEKSLENKFRETKEQLQYNFYNLEIILESLINNPKLNKYFKKTSTDKPVNREDVKKANREV